MIGSRRMNVTAFHVERYAVTIAMAALTAVPIAAQTETTFEVASIRENKECTGGSRRNIANDRLQVNCITGLTLLNLAVGNDQFSTKPQMKLEGMPNWLTTTYYSVSAKASAPMSSEQLTNKLLRALVAERFHFEYHLEQRETPVYLLTVAQKNTRLKPDARPCSDMQAAANSGANFQGPPPTDQPLCGDSKGKSSPEGLRLSMTPTSMEELATRFLSRLTDRPVLDRTGLTGRYSFDLEYAPAARPGAPVPDGPRFPDLPTALDEQLGLKLNPAKVPLDVVVVTRVERPSEN